MGQIETIAEGYAAKVTGIGEAGQPQTFFPGGMFGSLKLSRGYEKIDQPYLKTKIWTGSY